MSLCRDVKTTFSSWAEYSIKKKILSFDVNMKNTCSQCYIFYRYYQEHCGNREWESRIWNWPSSSYHVTKCVYISPMCIICSAVLCSFFVELQKAAYVLEYDIPFCLYIATITDWAHFQLTQL